MNVIGIVTEYNPFHNGHLYQINKIKEMYPDSLIVIAMSGNFTERGEISIINKWDKARIALKYGVDIVLEIPFVFSNQSADTFSYAAIKMLDLFKVDTLVFGSESNDLDLLIKNASIQLDNKDFDLLVKKFMNDGINYPTSLSKAIFELTGTSVSDSNDLLAISYIKEILKNKYNIKPVSIKRTNSFLDLTSDEEIISAMNIRNRLFLGDDISKYAPSETLSYINLYNKEKLFSLLKYKIVADKEFIKNYHLIDEGIHNRIYNSALISNDLDSLIMNIKTKRVTYNKVNRMLINILTSFTKDEAHKFKELEYIRVLGFSKKGQKYYKSIKKDTNIPVITKYENYDMLSIEKRVTDIYNILIDGNLDEIKNHVIIF